MSYVAQSMRERLTRTGHTVHALPELGTVRIPELITREALFCDPSATIRDAAISMTEHGGTAILVDWPWACLGPVWLDTVALLVNVNLYGGQDVEALLATATLQGQPLLAYAPGDAITGFLAGLTGFFLNVARLPDPPGLPTVRAFQQAQGDATLSWLRRRLEAS